MAKDICRGGICNMKTVLFIMRYPLDERHHLQNKFNGQMHAMVNLGYEVYHLGYNSDGVYLVNFKTQEKEKVCNTIFRNYRKYRNTLGFFDLYRALHKLSKKKTY